MNPNFDLTEEDKNLSRRLFNGKVVRVIIPNGNLIQGIAYRHMFPENNISFPEMVYFVENATLSEKQNEMTILTMALPIIQSVPTPLVRFIKDGNFHKLNIQTFGANLYDIPHEFDDKVIPSIPANFFSNLWTRIQSWDGNPNNPDYAALIDDLNLCGDELIKFKMSKEINERLI